MTEDGEANGETLPLRIEFTLVAEAEVDDAYLWLQKFGFKTAENWLGGLTAKLENEADLISTVSLRRQRAPDAPNGRELFLLLYRASGSGSSPWHIVYELLDKDLDGKPDTLCVVRVRHAAAGNR